MNVLRGHEWASLCFAEGLQFYSEIVDNILSKIAVVYSEGLSFKSQPAEISSVKSCPKALIRDQQAADNWWSPDWIHISIKI
jgi:hypothetical protein